MIRARWSQSTDAPSRGTNRVADPPRESAEKHWQRPAWMLSAAFAAGLAIGVLIKWKSRP